MKIMKNFFRWLPIAAAVTLMSAVINVSIQQNYRQNANDPQIQMAEDLGRALAEGRRPESLVSTTKIDMNLSLAPFVMVFDDKGNNTFSTATLDNQTPVPPKGVFDFTRNNGEDRVTWQPKPLVRNAIIVRYFKGKASGFVLVGRSLREVEKRENNLMGIVVVGWLTAMLATYILKLLAPKT